MACSREDLRAHPGRWGVVQRSREVRQASHAHLRTHERSSERRGNWIGAVEAVAPGVLGDVERSREPCRVGQDAEQREIRTRPIDVAVLGSSKESKCRVHVGVALSSELLHSIWG